MTIQTIFFILALWAFIIVSLVFGVWSMWHYFAALKFLGRRKRIVVGVYLTLLVLVCTAASAWVFVASSRVNEEIARIQAAGEPVTYASLRRPKLPAGTPDAGLYYASAISLTRAMGERPDRDALRAVRDVVKNRDLQSLSSVQMNEFMEYLDRYSQVLSILDIGNKTETYGDILFFSDYNEGLGGALSVGLLLMDRAYKRLLEGDGVGAAESVGGMFAFTRYLEQDLLIVYLVRVALLTKAGEMTAALSQFPSVSAADLARLAQLAMLAEPNLSLRKAIAGERTITLAMVGIPLTENGMDAAHSISSTYRELFPWPVRQVMVDSGLDYYRQMIEVLGHPMPQMLDDIRGVQAKGMYGVVFEMNSAYHSAAMQTGRAIAGLRASRLAIFCELYRRKHGQLPETLDQLVPEFIEAVPLDPFDGKAMKYKHDGNDVVIYSVNDNRKDDGGVLTPPHEKAEAPDWGYRLKLGGL